MLAHAEDMARMNAADTIRKVRLEAVVEALKLFMPEAANACGCHDVECRYDQRRRTVEVALAALEAP